MIITNEQLSQLVSAGGSVSLDASSMTFNQLRQLTVAAAGSKAHLTFTKLAGYTPYQLIELASLAPTLLEFDLTS